MIREFRRPYDWKAARRLLRSANQRLWLTTFVTTVVLLTIAVCFVVARQL